VEKRIVTADQLLVLELIEREKELPEGEKESLKGESNFRNH